jgi:hypothetical protein
MGAARPLAGRRARSYARILPWRPFLDPGCTFTPHDKMHGDDALTATLESASQPHPFSAVNGLRRD